MSLKPVSDLRTKLAMIKEVENSIGKVNFSAIGKKFGVDRRTVSRVFAQRDKLREEAKKGNFFLKRKHPFKEEDIGEALFLWFRSNLEQDARISRPILKQKAIEFARERGRDFEPSDNWIRRFTARYQLQEKVYGKKQANYDEAVSSVQQHDIPSLVNECESKDITNADETCLDYKGPDLYAQYPQNRQLSKDGKKKGAGDLSRLNLSVARLCQDASSRLRQEQFVEPSPDNAMMISEQHDQFSMQREMCTQKCKLEDSEDISLSRWLKIAQRATIRPSSSSHSPMKTHKRVTEEVKHHLTEAMLSQLGYAVKNCNSSQFEERLSVISDILEFWENGKTIWICGIDEDCHEESVDSLNSEDGSLAMFRHIRHNDEKDSLPNRPQVSYCSS